MMISLGRHCQAAHQLDRFMGPGRPAQFFDWLITPHDALLELLQKGFGELLALPNLASHGEHDGFHHIVDTSLGIEFFHDFPFALDIEARLATVQAKYAHLAQRFFALPGGTGCVFVRQSIPQECNPDHARAIQAALAARFSPGFVLMIVSDDPVEDWGLPGIAVVHVPQPDPYVWTGSDAAWDAAFRAIATA